MKHNKRSTKIMLALAGVMLMVIVLFFFVPNINPSKSSDPLYIPTGSTYAGLIINLKEDNRLLVHFSFALLSKVFLGDGEAKPGKYVLKSGMNNLRLIRMLRSGRQTPVSMTFNNVRLSEELAGKIANYIEPDSQTIVAKMKDSDFCASFGLDTHTIMSLFIPNTYQIYWNTDIDKLFKKMEEEHNIFWNKDGRKDKAGALDLSFAEVYTLASIVEKETLVNSEKPAVAGVYLNRMKTGMKLQADPTVVFAIREWDLKRVLQSHLAVDSPFNTYKYPGLPPGPICMPEISSVDAVLNAENHNYIYFCAKPGGGGEHAFAESFEEHLLNANAYRQWVDKLQQGSE